MRSILLFLLASFVLANVYMTPKDLSAYDGKDGNKAYVAVDGVIYDVTGVKPWSSGSHKGGMAGTDISKKISQAGHGKSVLEKREVVGQLVPGFTVKELSAYNGKDGQPAYIAVDGLIYDVSDVGAWRFGRHKGGTAGSDISDKIKDAWHKKSVLKKRKVVGKLID